MEERCEQKGVLARSKGHGEVGRGRLPPWGGWAVAQDSSFVAKKGPDITQETLRSACVTKRHTWLVPRSPLLDETCASIAARAASMFRELKNSLRSASAAQVM